MSKIASKYTERRLQQWAEWYGRCNFGLGYPPRSVEGRLRDEGGVLSKGYGLKLPPSNPDAEEVEAILVELNSRSTQQANAVKFDYLLEGPLTVKAKKMGISRSQYIIYRDLGLTWIDGRLTY